MRLAQGQHAVANFLPWKIVKGQENGLNLCLLCVCTILDKSKQRQQQTTIFMETMLYYLLQTMRAGMVSIM